MKRVAFALAICFSLTACEKVVDKVVDKVAERVAEKNSGKPAEKTPDKAAQKIAEKTPEKAPEQVTPKPAESALQPPAGKNTMEIKTTGPDGSVTTNVYTKDGITATTTQSDGKKLISEMGTAKLTTSELGVEPYPGAKIKQGTAMKMDQADKTMASVILETSDDFDKVASFYRAQMKAVADGRQLTDLSPNVASVFLSFSSDRQRDLLTVTINKKTAESTEVSILSSKKR
jgi:hypothetical protein